VGERRCLFLPPLSLSLFLSLYFDISISISFCFLYTHTCSFCRVPSCPPLAPIILYPHMPFDWKKLEIRKKKYLEKKKQVHCYTQNKRIDTHETKLTSHFAAPSIHSFPFRLHFIHPHPTLAVPAPYGYPLPSSPHTHSGAHIDRSPSIQSRTSDASHETCQVGAANLGKELCGPVDVGDNEQKYEQMKHWACKLRRGKTHSSLPFSSSPPAGATLVLLISFILSPPCNSLRSTQRRSRSHRRQ
jgi:hypothetical protein